MSYLRTSGGQEPESVSKRYPLPTVLYLNTGSSHVKYEDEEIKTACVCGLIGQELPMMHFTA